MAVTTPSVPASGTAAANPTGQFLSATVTGGTITGITVGYGTNPAPVLPSTPAIPASTVPATNNNPYPVAVAITGGTVTVVAVNGVTQFTATGVTVIVPAGGTVAITYSVVPTSWTWTPVVGGFTGTSIPSPSSVLLPPGCTVTLTYSVAPTWAWTNPINESQTPGFQYPFNSATPTPNQYTNLPYPQHAQLAQTNLGTGVSN